MKTPIPTRQELFELLDGGHDLYTIADILGHSVGILATILTTTIKPLDNREKLHRYLNGSVGYEMDLSYKYPRPLMGSMEYDENPQPGVSIKPRANYGGSYFTRDDVATMIIDVLEHGAMDEIERDGFELNDLEVPDYIRVIALNYAELAKEKELQRQSDMEHCFTVKR